MLHEIVCSLVLLQLMSGRVVGKANGMRGHGNLCPCAGEESCADVGIDERVDGKALRSAV